MKIKTIAFVVSVVLIVVAIAYTGLAFRHRLFLSKDKMLMTLKEIEAITIPLETTDITPLTDEDVKFLTRENVLSKEDEMLLLKLENQLTGRR